jgi:hypothetical protein
MSDERTEQWVVSGIPVFITRQLDPGDAIAFSMIYEPTDDNPNRYRISAVKVVGVVDPSPPPRRLPPRRPPVDAVTEEEPDGH